MSNTTSKCYAATLGDCEGGISREHPFSQAILKRGDQGNGILTEGLPFVRGKSMLLRPNALASNVLCRKHNAFLSPLDSEADQFEKSLQAAAKAAVEGTSTGRASPANGQRIEHWLLKLLAGSIAARSFSPSGSIPQTQLSIDPAWVEVLFHRTPWPDSWSLALFQPALPPSITFEGLDAGFTPLHNGDDIAGLQLNLIGLTFVLNLSDAGRPLRLPEAGITRVRPVQIQFHNSDTDSRCAVPIDWPPDVMTTMPSPVNVSGNNVELIDRRGTPGSEGR